MAKQQSFGDKSKSKKQQSGVNVKVVKAMKSTKGTFKFNERFIKLESVDKVTEIK